MGLRRFLVLTTLALGIYFSGGAELYSFFDSIFEKDTNVILVTIDTLQAKSLGLYGYSKDISPHIDDFAKDGVVFYNAFVVSNLTVPSHASILSSKQVAEHGVMNNRSTKIDPNVVLLPEILKENDYNTFATVAMSGLNPESSGLGKGFDYFSRTSDKKFKKKMPEVGIRASDITNSFIDWCENRRKGKFFAWIHYYDPHTYYIPPPEFNKFTKVDPLKFWKEIDRKRRKKEKFTVEDLRIGRALYDGEILYTDHEVGRLIEFLKKEGLYDDTLIVITNDHGEDVEDHGPYFFGHRTLFDEITKSVLIMKFPKGFLGNIKGKVDALVASTDIAPTILDYLDIEIPNSFSGRSLMPLINKDKKRIRDYVIIEEMDYMGYGIIFPDARYFYCQDDKGNFVEEFYDVKTDPAQSNNLIFTNASELKFAKSILRDWEDKGFITTEIDKGYQGDITTYHQNFFYLQANFSEEKKVIRYKLGENLKNKDFVLNLAEYGREGGRRQSIKRDFLKPNFLKDTKFKRSEDYSIRIKNNQNKICLYSRKIPIKYEHTWSLGFDYYTYSIDVYKDNPLVEVTVHFFAWLADGKSFWLKGKTQRAEKTVSEAGAWKHINYVKHFTDDYKAIGMMIEINGRGTVWLDNPMIGKMLKPFPANPWNDPDLKTNVVGDPDFTIFTGGGVISSLPFKSRLKSLMKKESESTPAGYSIFIYADEENLYFTLSGYPDETLYVELGGYIGSAQAAIKKAEESKGLTEEDIENLKALGYIQ